MAAPTGNFSSVSPPPLRTMPELPLEERARGLAVARSQKVAVFVVAYNAESHIRETLRRIPRDLLEHLTSVYVIDDWSRDNTRGAARELQKEMPLLEVFRTPYNQGYGGNQKLGYEYALRHGLDVVVLLHGDGQYAPEVLPMILAPFEDPETAAVFGSRMLVPGEARRGGMPLYKYMGNKVLTALENALLGASLSEFHSGYRAYRVQALERVPFRYNTNDFHFDTEIIIQFLARGLRIVEVPIPTYYGDEICHVEGVPYALHCLGTVLRSRVNRLHLVYHPKFDVFGSDEYVFKEAPNSLHQHVVHLPFKEGMRVLELGAGHGEVGRALHERGAKVVAVDQRRPERPFAYPYLELDLDAPFAERVLEAQDGPAQVALALDVIEHLGSPEASIQELRRVLAPGGQLLASTGNVGFLLLRLMLGLGQFNYGKKGILDLTHHRLFTVRSFCRTLEGEGFRVERVLGFGPPIRDMVGGSPALHLLDSLAGFLARAWPGLFAYQFLVEATRLDDVDTLLERTLAAEEAGAEGPVDAPGPAQVRDPG